MPPPQHAPLLLSSTPATAALPPPVTFTLPAELRGSQAASYLNSNFPSEPLDARPNPRFASHLTPIYTEALAREYELEQTNARLDAEWIASTKQAAQKITIYAWKPDADEPEIRSIQQGFTWPYFKLSPAILSLVDLERAGELGALQMYDDVNLEAWIAVDVGHIMVVYEGQRVFLRDRSAKNCPGFDKHLKEIHHPHPSPKAILGVQRILFEIFFRISASKIRRSSLLSAFLKLLRLRDGAIHVDTSILVPQTVVNVNGPKLVKSPQE